MAEARSTELDIIELPHAKVFVIIVTVTVAAHERNTMERKGNSLTLCMLHSFLSQT